MLCIGEMVSVNWDAGKWSHTGHFPIQWLSENKYLEKKKRELPTTVSYSFKRQFNHYCSLSCQTTLPKISFLDIIESDEGAWR